MANTVDIMMNCIKSNIFNAEFENQYFESVTDEEWDKVFSLSVNHDLVHIVGDFVVKSSLVSNPDLVSKFSNQAFSAFKRFSSQNYELENIKKVFNDNKIEFVVLKGPVIRKLYPEEWLRTSCDIDILVKKESLKNAENILKSKLNYYYKKQNYHDISLLSPSGVKIELHFSITEHIENIDNLLKDVWDYTIPSTEDTYEKILTPEYQIFHTVAHLYYHFVSGGCGIRPVMDLKLLTEKTEYNNDILYQMLKKTKIDVFYEKVLLLGNIWFGNESYDDLSREFARYILVGGVYGSMKNKILSEQTKTSKSKNIIRRIFMPYELLCLRYRDKSIKKWQTPFYQIIRWIDVIKEGSAKKGINELKTHANADKTDVETTRELMDYLNIK